jgi:signal transduction histidine kinase
MEADSSQTATHPDPQTFALQFDCSDAVRHRNAEPLALLVHELRSPLAAIQNAIAVLRLRGREESLQQRMHELIERQVRQIAHLAASPCQMAGSGLAVMPLQTELVELGAVLTRALETATPEFTQRFNQIAVSLPESNTWVMGDAARLEQVFVNLLSNASKYSDVGGQIAVAMHVDAGHAVVQVRDYGVGIAATSLPHIFGLFIRVDSAAVRKRSGLGIGLALVRSIIDAHEGTVSAASEGLGMGSEFTVRLKIRP